VGDTVYLKLQPYIQTSVARCSIQKLSFKFYGPHTILKKVGVVAYKLELPAGSRIHDVVHVSQLKRHLPSQQQISDIQSILALESDVSLQPVQILETRSIQHGGHAVPQVRVTWDTAMPASVTWEDAWALHHQFPHALAWGQASSQGVGHVAAQSQPMSR
jgi:hypothetical protein